MSAILKPFFNDSSISVFMYKDDGEQLDISLSRQNFEVLINCRKGRVSAPLRHALMSIGFDRVSSTLSYEHAIEEAKEQDYHFVFFDSYAPEHSSVETSAFIESFSEIQPRSILIAVSTTPTAANIFKVIKCGARGYLVPPFTPEVMEEILVRTTQAPKIDSSVLDEANRNGALAKMIFDNLNLLSEYITKIQKQINLEEIDLEESEENMPSYEEIIKIDRYSAALAESVRAARKFCEGSHEDLVNALIDESIRRAMSKSKINTARQKLREQRASSRMDEKKKRRQRRQKRS